MSYDLMVFDTAKAPRAKEEFMVWFNQQSKWEEPHDYTDISVTSPPLKNWFMEMKENFPPLNGTYAPTDEMIAEDEDLEARLTDYSVGYDMIYVGFGWSVSEEAYLLASELAQKHGVGFYDVSSGDGKIIFLDDSELKSVSKESAKKAKIIEVQTQKEYLPLNFLRQIIPMTVWIGLAIAVVLFLIFFIVVGGSLLIYDLTGVDSLGTLADNLMELFDELFMQFWTTVLIGVILGVIGAGLMAFYFQNIKITVDDKAVSFWRGKKQYRTFNLADHEIRSHIQKTYHYFLFKTTTRYLTVKKSTGKWRKKYQCHGISEADFNKLLNHIWFDTIPITDTDSDEEIEKEIIEESNFEIDVESYHMANERPELREAVAKQLEETEEYDIFPITFQIDKEAYIKGCKKEIISNFAFLLFVPIVVIIFMLILDLPFYVMQNVLQDSFPVLAVLSGIVLAFVLYRNIKQIIVIQEIKTTTPTSITVDQTTLQLESDSSVVKFSLNDIEEIQVTPPSYYTKDNLHTIRRHLTTTTKDGLTKRFFLGDAHQAKWLYWLNFQKSRRNVFEDYTTFCQVLQIWLADENENRFKLELE